MRRSASGQSAAAGVPSPGIEVHGVETFENGVGEGEGGLVETGREGMYLNMNTEHED
jgi:hypothetical protein